MKWKYFYSKGKKVWKKYDKCFRAVCRALKSEMDIDNVKIEHIHRQREDYCIY